MTTEVVRRTVTACISVESAEDMCDRIRKGMVHHAATFAMLAEIILELDESGGWKLYEDDEGKQRYRDVWACLDDRVLRDLGSSKAVVKHYRRCAYAVAQLFGNLSSGVHAGTLPHSFPTDPQLKYPAMPEKAIRQLARLNDFPKDQRRAFDLAMQASNGRLTEKGVAIQVSRLLPSEPEEELSGAELRKWVGRLLGSFESNLKAMQEEERMPKKIVTKTKNLIKVMNTLYERIAVE